MPTRTETIPSVWLSIYERSVDSDKLVELLASNKAELDEIRMYLRCHRLGLLDESQCIDAIDVFLNPKSEYGITT